MEETAKDKRKTILVTGGLGFIGGHVVEALHADFPDDRIVILDKFTYAVRDSTVKAINALERCKIVPGDLLDEKRLREIFSEHTFTHIMHFAAESHVDRSYGNSVDFSRNNVVGTHNLLEAWRCSRSRDELELFVHVSTDEVHGTVDEKTSAEGAEKIKDAMLLPTNPYAASKAAAEMQIHAYRTSYGLPSVITRGNNAYGPRQHPEKLVPGVLSRLLAGKKAQIHGDGMQTRSFIFVKDIARAFSGILKHVDKCLEEGVLLIGSSDEKTVKNVVESCCVAAGREKDDCVEFVPNPRPFNDQRYLSGMSPCVLDWVGGALTPWDTGIRVTTESVRSEILKLEH